MTSIEMLRAVHHPTRRRIIDFLGLNGPSRVGLLAGALDEQVGSISHHLRMLERVGVVTQVRELATDGRTSWWRLDVRSLAWSVDDFADSPADRAQAKAAERVNIDHQLGRLSAWKRAADAAPATWRRAAFTTDTTTKASAEELARLHELLEETLREWRAGIDLDDDQEREPVFVFAHGFPTAP
ncbi:MAG TPA: helix-turn-helix domain-containing protein [Nocardioides sp.]|nr:helix-turn-helix domain-containing protein [Nocardioides sp.]